MHHAAMANKKDMMFALARLGCDWRTRADGIDHASASFVLCGQHGKTTRQQRLLDAKLRRLYQEGEAAREAGRNPLADARDDDNDDATGGDWSLGFRHHWRGVGGAARRGIMDGWLLEAQTDCRRRGAVGVVQAQPTWVAAPAAAWCGVVEVEVATLSMQPPHALWTHHPTPGCHAACFLAAADLEAEQALADAAMAALLEEVEGEQGASQGSSKKGSKKKKRKAGKAAAAAAVPPAAPAEAPAEAPAAAAAAAAAGAAAQEGEEEASAASPSSEEAADVEDTATSAGPSPAAAPPSPQRKLAASPQPADREERPGPAAAATATLEGAPSGPTESVGEVSSEASEHETMRQQLEAAAEAAARLLAEEEHSEEGLEDCVAVRTGGAGAGGKRRHWEPEGEGRAEGAEQTGWRGWFGMPGLGRAWEGKAMVKATMGMLERPNGASCSTAGWLGRSWGLQGSTSRASQTFLP